MVYIQNRMIPMWPDGWMKVNDIQSQCMPKEFGKDSAKVKPKEKEPKKPTNEHKPVKPSMSTANSMPAMPILVDSSKDNPMMTHSVEKKKSHAAKESTKLVKNNDKPATHKSDKKHPINPLDRIVPSVTATVCASASSTASMLLMPSLEAFNSKSV